MYLHSSIIYNKLKYDTFYYLNFLQESLLKPKVIFKFMDDIIFDMEPHLEGSTHFTNEELNILKILIRSDNDYDCNDELTMNLFYKIRLIICNEILRIKKCGI